MLAIIPPWILFGKCDAQGTRSPDCAARFPGEGAPPHGPPSRERCAQTEHHSYRLGAQRSWDGSGEGLPSPGKASMNKRSPIHETVHARVTPCSASGLLVTLPGTSVCLCAAIVVVSLAI